MVALEDTRDIKTINSSYIQYTRQHGAHFNKNCLFVNPSAHSRGAQSLARLALPAADAIALRLQADPLAHPLGAQPLAHQPCPCTDAVAVRPLVDSPALTAHPQTSPAHPPHSASGTLTGVEPHDSSVHEQHPPSRRTTPADRPDGPQDGDMAVVGPTTYVRRVCAHISRWCRLLREAVT